MISIVRRWGNGLGVRIPKRVAQKMGISKGDPVRIVRRADRFESVPAVGRYSLKDLVRGIRPSNMHIETDWG